MKVSNRISGITGGGSDGWDVFYRARAMKAAGADITELTIGEHDVRTHPDILAAMDAAARGGHTGYATVPGTDDLRDAVAARIERQSGVPTTRNNILITPGGQAALFAAHHAVIDEGDTALFVDPYYTTYPGTLRAAGAVPRAIVTSALHSFRPTAAQIETEAAGARSLLINTPNNPTGVVYDRTTLDEIAQACHDHDLWLISDEVYDTQVWQGQHISPRSLPGMADRVLVIGSMSKSHAMTGSRIGWVCGPEHVIAHLINLATHTTYGVAGFIQDAALFALSQGNDPENAVAAPFMRRREMSLTLLAGQDTVRAVPPQGAMYLMLDVRKTGLSGDAFATALLDTCGIAVMPGESFGAAAAGHVRVAMTVADEAYAEALETMIRFAKDTANAST